MEVLYDEGVAIHIGPEPCAVDREVGGEASVGEHVGQRLSRESFRSERRRRLTSGRRDDHMRDRECVIGSAWSETLACMDVPCTGTGRSPARPDACVDLVRIGKTMSRSR